MYQANRSETPSIPPRVCEPPAKRARKLSCQTEDMGRVIWPHQTTHVGDQRIELGEHIFEYTCHSRSSEGSMATVQIVNDVPYTIGKTNMARVRGGSAAFVLRFSYNPRRPVVPPPNGWHTVQLMVRCSGEPDHLASIRIPWMQGRSMLDQNPLPSRVYHRCDFKLHPGFLGETIDKRQVVAEFAVDGRPYTIHTCNRSPGEHVPGHVVDAVHKFSQDHYMADRCRFRYIRPGHNRYNRARR